MSPTIVVLCVILVMTAISGQLFYFSQYCKRRHYFTPRFRQQMKTFGVFLGMVDACYIAIFAYLILFHH